MSAQKIAKWGFLIAALVVLFLLLIPSVTLPTDKTMLALLLLLFAFFFQRESSGSA